jgi:hypothetical protein
MSRLSVHWGVSVMGMFRQSTGNMLRQGRLVPRFGAFPQDKDIGKSG